MSDSMNGSVKLTPLMQQYWEIKNQHQDKILLFRMGDFFEIFHDDAVVAAPLLGIALTQRNKKSADETPMCGMPHHSVAGPIAKLLTLGHKVAICDQIEDPRLAKGLVKRAVTRVLTPGMVYDPDTLDQLSANYLCSWDGAVASFLDVTTGEAFFYRVVNEGEAEKLLRLLAPKEVVLSREQKVMQHNAFFDSLCVSTHEIPENSLSEVFSYLPKSAQRLLSYVSAMQGLEILETLSGFQERHLNRHVDLSPTVVRHLEMFATYRGDERGSLFFAINRTKTSAGARRLKDWLRFPLSDVKLIESRWDQVSGWVKDPSLLKRVRDVFSRMGDIERRLGKIATPQCSARDLLALSQSVEAGIAIESLRATHVDGDLLKMAQQLAFEIRDRLVEEPPIAVREGGIFRKGVVPALDELILLSEESGQMLLQMEQHEREATGISSLKIRYNNVFGYYIEITNTHREKVPDHYKRKQTLANAERYLTQELQELEEKVLSARTRRGELEFELFQTLRKKVLSAVPDLMSLARQWSELDVFCSMAWLALEYNYVRPVFSSRGVMRLLNSRHPVVEQEVSSAFVPNTVELRQGECLLLTGPNMAGKSTLMRQVAIAVIMAQMGSFVPAEQAEIPVFQHLFTRIGASDSLSEGLSTFMVEMKEAAEMLDRAGPHSLVVLDEIGRGTSTYDGMSLAQAILEHLVTKSKATTLFATHYHELTGLSRQYTQVHNFHMSIRERGGDIQFLHTLVSGPANKSYGIQVAKLAGLPPPVTLRAKHLLQKLEDFGSKPAISGQMSLVDVELDAEEELKREWEELVQEIRTLALQKITPLEALNTIAKWQQSLS